MAKFVLTFVQPQGPAPANIDEIMRDVDALDQELRTAGLWVFACGLEPAAQTTTVRADGRDVHESTGPVVASDESVGGFTVVEVHDRAEAVSWAGRFAHATGLPIEVRAAM
ncbi:YciI family protein [Cellulomonas sp. HZM]|uniref:YciI family protein n=1 Tax=Cellulomonas sp. HZM TaxID=1454010 RepID=UPI000493A41C|nr:YciI family protein [Cellulomonas sp. HZM]